MLAVSLMRTDAEASDKVVPEEFKQETVTVAVVSDTAMSDTVSVVVNVFGGIEKVCSVTVVPDRSTLTLTDVVKGEMSRLMDEAPATGDSEKLGAGNERLSFNSAFP